MMITKPTQHQQDQLSALRAFLQNIGQFSESERRMMVEVFHHVFVPISQVLRRPPIEEEYLEKQTEEEKHKKDWEMDLKANEVE